MQAEANRQAERAHLSLTLTRIASIISITFIISPQSHVR
jgi:hypothetical protein